jgi:ATP-dependent exoDNAse (exonuclease V) beta subunit
MTPKQGSIVWASANKTDKTLENISKYPIPYGPTMKNSAFSEEYWREFVMSHMDNINLLYVAVTRAKKELYMYVPTGKDYTNISGIIEEVLPKMDKMQHDEPIRNDDNKVMYQRYYYGEKIEHNTPKDDKQENGNFLLKDYPTHSTKVNIYKKLNRFTKEGSKPGTTACNKGIKMHKAFEGANTIDDLYESIEQMVNNGYIKHTEAESLRIDIEKATSNTLVAEWFSGEWDVVKCEEELLCQEGTIRPDRVMIKGDKVVVVDYKFGAVPDNDHHEQVAKYISALQNMGCYNTIEGYVWYVHLNKIEKSTQN